MQYRESMCRWGKIFTAYYDLKKIDLTCWKIKHIILPKIVHQTPISTSFLFDELWPESQITQGNQMTHEYCTTMEMALWGWTPRICPWWRHQMQTFPRHLCFVRGDHRSPVNSPHKGQWRGDLVFSLRGLCLNKRLRNQSRRRWFTTPSRSLWRNASNRFYCLKHIDGQNDIFFIK